MQAKRPRPRVTGNRRHADRPALHLATPAAPPPCGRVRSATRARGERAVVRAGPLTARRRAAYLAQAAAALGFYGLFRLLPPRAASALGARVGRAVGPLLRGQTRRADRHLAVAYPDASPAWRRGVRQGMWASLGALVGEYAHLDRFLQAARAELGQGRRPTGTRVELVGYDPLVAEYWAGRPPLGALAHLANWEVGACAMAALGLPGYVFYRQFNNPYTNRLMNRLIAPVGIGRLGTGESKQGGRKALGLLRKGYALGVIVDQHIDSGIQVPFFGHPAATSPAGPDLARHLGRKLFPIRVERLGPAHFRVTVEEPIDVPKTRDRLADVTPAVAHLTATVERWVRERPDQWLWLHRRWKASVTPRAPREAPDPADG